jgi:protein-tyrosine phosphatase
MIRAAVEFGTTTIVCTPHLYDLDFDFVERVRRIHAETVAAVEEAGIAVRLLSGFEVDLSISLTCDLETLRALCVQSPEGATDALIMETPPSGWPPMIEQNIRRLVTNGIVPLLAHPERNDRVQRSPDILAGCLDSGAVLQGTAGSFTPLFRRESHKTFYELLARGWFGVLASDSHSDPEYTWSLGPLLGELGDRVTQEEQDLLISVNPARVLEGKQPIPITRRRSPGKGWRRLF